MMLQNYFVFIILCNSLISRHSFERGKNSSRMEIRTSQVPLTELTGTVSSPCPWSCRIPIPPSRTLRLRHSNHLQTRQNYSLRRSCRCSIPGTIFIINEFTNHGQTQVEFRNFKNEQLNIFKEIIQVFNVISRNY